MILFKIIADTQKEMIALDEAIYSDDHWFGKLDEKAFSIKHKALQLPERSREGTWWCWIKKVKFQVGIKQIIKVIKVIIKGKLNQKRASSLSPKHQAVTEKLKVAKPLEKQRFMEKRKAAEYEAANLQI